MGIGIRDEFKNTYIIYKMKRKIFVYILVSFISVCFINCENHDTPTNEMQVTTCGEKIQNG